MKAEGRQGRHHWLRAFHENQDAASGMKDDLDIVFYGDSMTEGWMGTSYGSPDSLMETNLDTFQAHFTLEGGGKYKGLALGLADDRVSSSFHSLFVELDGILVSITDMVVICSVRPPTCCGDYKTEKCRNLSIQK